MDISPAENPYRPDILVHAFAGLQAGVVGVVWMFLCFFAGAVWSGGGIWSVPNLFATAFYGEYAYQNEFFRTTWAGIALIVVIYGLIGAVWGCIWRGQRRPLLTFLGVITGIVVYYLSFNFVWPRVDPLIPLYAPLGQMQLAHILWGAALSKSPIYSNRITAALAPPPVPVFHQTWRSGWRRRGQRRSDPVKGFTPE